MIATSCFNTMLNYIFFLLALRGIPTPTAYSVLEGIVPEVLDVALPDSVFPDRPERYLSTGLFA